MTNCDPLHGCLVLTTISSDLECLLLKNVFSIIFVSSVYLTGCAGSNAPQIMTDEKFNSRITEQGTTEFVYGITWQNTSQASLLRDGRKEIKRSEEDQRGFSERPDRLAMQANNQTKLDLEDQAAAALKLRLAKEQLCKKGYEISDVLWKQESIRLLGFCF